MKLNAKNKKTFSLFLLVGFASLPLAQADDYKPPKNSWGHPDIGGVWSNATTTKFERPREFGSNLILTPEQAGEVQGAAESYRAAGNVRTDPSQGAPTDKNTNAGYNRFWTDPGTQVMYVRGKPVSSMITTTPDGRVPPRKKDAPPYQRRRGPSEFSSGGMSRNDNPEGRGLPERCIFMPTTAGPVMRPVLYNNNYLIAQGKDHVAIVVEMIHDQRIIRIGGEHRNDGVKQWMGDSIGWYEGDTLVVHTKDYHPQQTFYGASDALEVIERFTRVAEDHLLYEFEIKDEKVWDEAWGGEYEFWASPGFYEYACHEGNIGLEGILAGARREEREAAKE